MADMLGKICPSAERLVSKCKKTECRRHEAEGRLVFFGIVLYKIGTFRAILPKSMGCADEVIIS